MARLRPKEMPNDGTQNAGSGMPDRAAEALEFPNAAQMLNIFFLLRPAVFPAGKLDPSTMGPYGAKRHGERQEFIAPLGSAGIMEGVFSLDHVSAWLQI